MTRVLNFIQKNLDRPLPLEDLAAVACFSPYHFHRVFRGMVGESVQQHVRRLRLERAAQHLKVSERSVLMIALDAGYETHESFTRAFGQAFGCAPTEFRRASRSARLAAPTRVHFSTDEALHFHPLEHQSIIMETKIRELPSQHVLFLRHVGPYQNVGTAWEELCSWAGPKGLIDGETRMLGACYDDPDVTPADKIRYDACLTVREGVQGEGAIAVQDLPAGRYASTIHEGCYSKLNETYGAIMGGWFAQQDFEPADGPSLEFYLNSPEDTEPDDLLTEIYVPIKE